MQKTKGVVTASVVVGLLPSGCAHGSANVPFSTSSLLPAAEGKATLSGSDQANKTLHVVVHHLAEPQNLSPQAVSPSGNPPTTPQTYIVWLQPAGGGAAMNMGALMPDKDLDAQLTTTTSYRKLDVFITAEPSPSQTAPTGQHRIQACVQE